MLRHRLVALGTTGTLRHRTPAVDRRRGGRYAAGMDYTHLITVEPGKRSGQPCVRGMRLTVRDVFEYLAGGMTVDELLADFPELTLEDVRACFAYAAAQLARPAA